MAGALDGDGAGERGRLSRSVRRQAGRTANSPGQAVFGPTRPVVMATTDAGSRFLRPATNSGVDARVTPRAEPQAASPPSVFPAASSIIGFSSPLACISSVMSQPPTSSPPM
jgi:hypothetical protein